jgi:tetratricopeptide (TPR) repeat protein
LAAALIAVAAPPVAASPVVMHTPFPPYVAEAKVTLMPDEHQELLREANNALKAWLDDDRRRREAAEAFQRLAAAVELLESYFRSGLPPQELVTLHNLLGDTYMYMGRARQAEPHYREAFALAWEMGDHRATANALGNLGNVYCRQGELDKAEQYLRAALAIQHEIGDRLGEAVQLEELGVAYAQRRDAPRALEHLRRARDIFADIGASLDLARVGRSIAWLQRCDPTLQP